MKNYNYLKKNIKIDSDNYTLYSLNEYKKTMSGNISSMPFSIKVLFESLLCNYDGYIIKEDDVLNLANYEAQKPKGEIPFIPARVILQDFTGVPAIVDLAALRSAIKQLGGAPHKINPTIPVDLVIDHSVQVDMYGEKYAYMYNIKKELERNQERYKFLKWGQHAFSNFRVIPPGQGIVHQVNLEYLAKGIFIKKQNESSLIYSDTLVGTDSHTPMINALGIVGWGVGGIEAEAAMLAQPIYIKTPEVIGFQLSGHLQEGITATDMALTITQMLRKYGVVGKFVEFYGDGLSQMSIPDRATIANMAPEYGATVSFFPVDDQTLSYLHSTGRDENHLQLLKYYLKKQGLFRYDGIESPKFKDYLSLDLCSIKTSLAGPKRPQDRVILSNIKNQFEKALYSSDPIHGFSIIKNDSSKLKFKYDNTINETIENGSIVLAAITSCTNTSNPNVMIGAGIVAKKACELGLSVPKYVKTSLAPGSQVVTKYLDLAGLTPYLEQLGFNLVGYGCTTCIGNSGPLLETIQNTIKEKNLIVVGVLSGNRNFEGRIHPYIKANYLASPPLVVAYALAGKINIDFNKESIGKNKNGTDVFLKDIWPSAENISHYLKKAIRPELFKQTYKNVFNSEVWNNIEILKTNTYQWDKNSTYIQKPPFFDNITLDIPKIKTISNANVLIWAGDSVTTDHISPAGAIKPDSPAGQYLQKNHVAIQDFNSYGSRRGNDRVMLRGTFANVRFRNILAPDLEGGYTKYHPTKEIMTIFDASNRYKKSNTPLIILGGKEYGTGSSRDWAAKGTALLGVKAVIAESYERIHRSNLVGMGVIPLQFKSSENVQSIGLNGTESYTIALNDDIQPQEYITVHVKPKIGKPFSFQVISRIDTSIEVDYIRHGGVLNYILRHITQENKSK